MKTERKEGGFSIIEMMITMAIFLVVIGSVYGLLQVGFVDRNRASRQANILKNARIALHLIGRDALNAGLSYHRIGGLLPNNAVPRLLNIPLPINLPPNDTNRDFLTSIIAGNDIFLNNLNPSVGTDTISFVYRDLSFNGGNTISLTDASVVSSNTIDLITPSGGATNAKPFDLYLVESDSSQVVVMVTEVPASNRIRVSTGDPLGINQSLSGTGSNVSLLRKCNPPTIVDNCTTYVASAKRIFWVAYRVLNDGTLVRITFGNNTGASASDQIQQMPIAYNVQDLQIQYLMDDGRVLDDPIAGPDGIRGTVDDTPLAMNDVRQINISITVQSPEVDEQTKAFKTITLTASFSTRNVIYDAG